MRTVVYRRSLSYTSGAGQLIAMQVRALRAAGVDAQLACQRGALRFWMRSGLRARRLTSSAADLPQELSGSFVVDHGMEVPTAGVVFCHNLMSEAQRFLTRPEIDAAAQLERAFFSSLNPDAVVVANSRLVRDAIAERFAWPQAQLQVCYPGYRAAAFAHTDRAPLRARARRSLGIHEDTPLVGFVTSGDLHKRGLGVFLDAAVQMLASRPRLRFLIVGSKSLPDWTRHHPLVARGSLLHRARGTHPQRWMAALDVFVYPARFEEFGMVVLEASALGVPVVTSQRVGAAECLSASHTPWIAAQPDPSALADLTLRLLDDAAARERLSRAGIDAAAGHTDAHYAQQSASIVTGQLEAAT